MSEFAKKIMIDALLKKHKALSKKYNDLKIQINLIDNELQELGYDEQG